MNEYLLKVGVFVLCNGFFNETITHCGFKRREDK